MGASISQVQTSQGNQPVNPRPTSANYSPAQQQYGGGKGGVMPMQANPTGQTPLMGQSPYQPQAQVPFAPYSTTTEQDMMGHRGSGASFGQVMGQMGMGGGMGFPTISPQQELPVGATPDQNIKAQGKGQKVMYSPLSNQPKMGQQNPYPNTIGQWDNSSIQPQPRQSGKGKGI